MHYCELVVSLVLGVGVDDDPPPALRAHFAPLEPEVLFIQYRMICHYPDLVKFKPVLAEEWLQSRRGVLPRV
jgi:hypothetical protein